jgi:cyclopropane-fatty-acyl-phospholipid synthase
VKATLSAGPQPPSTQSVADRRMPTATPAGTAARTALKLLQRLQQGTLTVQLPDGSLRRFGNGQGPSAMLALRNWNPCAAALKSGDIDFAEGRIIKNNLARSWFV